MKRPMQKWVDQREALLVPADEQLFMRPLLRTRVATVMYHLDPVPRQFSKPTTHANKNDC